MFDSIAEVFARNGPLADLVREYSPRNMQIEMAKAIAGAIDRHESLICEAGTGTGKTLAYLIPAALSGRRIIVSTGTRHLQDQIFHKDLPAVLRATGAQVQISVLKGRNNYLCLHHYKDIESDPLPDVRMSELAQIRTWAQATHSGDLGEVLPEQSSLRERITSTADNCLGQGCDFYEECHVLKARRRAQETDIVIVNHSLLLSDMALRDNGFGELLPDVDCIIFDEAHQLAEMASQYFGISVSSRQLQELIRDTGKGCKTEAADIPGFNQQLHDIEQAIIRTRAILGAEDQRISWDDNAVSTEHREVLYGLEALVRNTRDVLLTQSERGRELENCYRRFVTVAERLQGFLHDREHKMVTWIETRGRGFLFHQTPLNIAGEFQSRLKNYDCHCIYTSATLTVNQRFDHFAGQLGLDDTLARSWPGPFNYRQQALLYLPDGMPHPMSEEYTRQVIEKSLPVLAASRGRAFLLFTSHRALRIAAESIQQRLPWTILVQGEKSRLELLEEFRHDEHSVLLGTGSFWEGVDVKGPSLSCVIIDKLPFAAPDDPVLKARSIKMEEQGQNPFMAYQLPLAVIQLKQGIGRLIRDESDRGVLMICDPRITGKSYGRIFLRSLPDMRITDEITAVQDFFAGKLEYEPV